MIWSIAMFLHPWAWQGTVVWCALLASIAAIVVRLCPRQRGLIVTVLVLTNISQCIPDLRVGLMHWLHDVGHPIAMFGFMWYALFQLVAVPVSILVGSRVAQRQVP